MDQTALSTDKRSSSTRSRRLKRGESIESLGKRDAMSANSKIEWTHHTFNPWRGCTKVSAGCANCYAETQSGRNPRVLGVWGPKGTRVVAAEAYWREPLKWDAQAKAAGERRRVFCASLADVF